MNIDVKTINNVSRLKKKKRKQSLSQEFKNNLILFIDQVNLYYIINLVNILRIKENPKLKIEITLIR